MMKVLILSCVVAVVAAAPTVVLSDNDGTSCKMIKAGTTIESNCDQAVQGRPSASILGNHNALQELQRINVLQARENTALRKLVAELTTRVDQLAQTQSQTMETLRNQYEAADDKLQDAINHISLTPGPQGAPGQKGERGSDGVDGADGSRGSDGAPGRDGAKGAKGEQGETPTLPPTPPPALPSVVKSFNSGSRTCGNGCCPSSMSFDARARSNGFNRGAHNYADTLQGVELSSSAVLGNRNGFVQISFDGSFSDIHRDYYSLMSSSDGKNWNLNGGYCKSSPYPGRSVGARQLFSRKTCVPLSLFSKSAAVRYLGINLGHGHLPDISSMELVDRC